MISNAVKEQILEAARIEEVVGEFVTLKRRGANLLGLCPFHNERTPSFTVSPVKGFFKCFGCGKAGDAATFVMEHEHLTFPEALKWLAGKYNIPVEEEIPTPELLAAQSQRESLFIVTTFAAQFYAKQLWETEEGKAIGLSYFHERGFSDDTIRKFGLGYTTHAWDDLLNAAKQEGYNIDYLEQAGLVIVKEDKTFDRFRDRVMFPIHNLSGRVIAFGGRILKPDPKAAKYINSPETEIYHKSKSLYGISFARKEISNQDMCYLVEGYTDVISMHQAGIENVVASSGTSLTVEQIRLIGRYTRNITVLYDGDPAGIKASLRGIDLILEEGMNVRVVLFPEGDDPDSYSKKVSQKDLKDFLTKEAVDFISFKIRLLLKDTENDPIRKSQLVRDIVETIAKVPDAISRSAYLHHTSVLMEMDEKVLIGEINKLLRKKLTDYNTPAPEERNAVEDAEELPEETEEVSDEFSTTKQEEEIIRILLEFADNEFELSSQDDAVTDKTTVRVKDFVISELLSDGIHFTDEKFAGIFAEFTTQVEQETGYDQQQFFAKLDPEILPVAVSMVTPHYQLSDWEAKGITIRRDFNDLAKAVVDPVIYLKKKQLAKLRKENQEQIRAREQAGLPYDELLEKEILYNNFQEQLNKFTSTVVQK